MKNYDEWKTTNPADAYLSQEEVDIRELDLEQITDRLYQDNERLRAEVERLERENKRLRWLMTVAQAVR